MVLPLGDVEKTRIVPIATYTLIALNILMYLVQLMLPESFTIAFAATPYEITNNVDIAEPVPIRLVAGQDLQGRIIERVEMLPQAPVPFPVWMTLLTSMFLHGSLLHLLGNMLYLWIFGDNVEEVLGSACYIVVYLFCGLVACLAQIALAPESLIPTLGASGAIAGVMGAYLIWFPTNRVRVLFIRVIVEMPAVVVIGMWIILQVWGGLGTIGAAGETGGVAYMAHVGGAGAGILAALIFRDFADKTPPHPTRVGWSRYRG